MDEPLDATYWCHMCLQMVNPVMDVEIKCPSCGGGFVEEVDSRRDQDPDLGSDRALSLWAPILLGMMGGNRRLQRFRRESQSEEEEEETQGESEEERDPELILRRRRSSAAILHLLHSLRTGIESEQENSEENRERDEEQEREQLVLVNPFNQAIFLQGSLDGNQTQNQNQSIPGSLGDYLIGPSLDQLLQHLSENDPNKYGTPPAKKEAVEAMPTVTIKENLECSICLDDFDIGSEVKEMPCKHKFHSGCILPWLELHSSCPVCRFQMPADDGSKVARDGSGDNSDMVEGSGGEEGNGRRNWLSIPWPFNGLFSLSGSESGDRSAASSPPPPPPPPPPS